MYTLNILLQVIRNIIELSIIVKLQKVVSLKKIRRIAIDIADPAISRAVKLNCFLISKSLARPLALFENIEEIGESAAKIYWKDNKTKNNALENVMEKMILWIRFIL